MPLRRFSILVPFFVSGFTALVFEVVWAKQAYLIFGNTTLASAAVIAAYMTGLAGGSFLFGRVADRHPKRALWLYGLLEGIIGLFALCFPSLVRLLEPVYQTIYVAYHQDFFTISLIRFLLSFALLAVPTLLMGGTLPLLSRFVSRSPETMNADINRLYMVNLLGATAGSFASGFILIRVFGLWTTSVLAAAANILLCVYVWGISRRSTVREALSAQAEETASEAAPPRTAFLLIATMAIHGFVAFVIQICWTRTMALILGSSTYAFSAMLTTFLLGLGIGTWVVQRLAKRKVGLSMSSIGFMEIAAGASVLAFIPAFEWAIFYFIRLYPSIQGSFLRVLAAQFLFCAMTMIVPAALIGLVFPAALHHLGRPKDIGRIVGRAYAANTLGGVLGAFTAAFFFIGNLGVNGSLRLASVLAIASGALLVALSSGPKLKLNLSRVAVATLFAGLFFMYPWDKNLFSSGVFMYAEGYVESARLGMGALKRTMTAGHKLLFYKDGISSTVSVYEHERFPGSERIPTKSLRVNGKVDASTLGDMSTQLYCGLLPLFAKPDAQDVLVIGLGSGVTVGAVTLFDSVRAVDAVEIEPAVIAANRFFEVESHYALKDPRVRTIVGDGRNHISFSPKLYDVIISVPSNPWISGISSLFTKENYELALKKLRPGGVYCQWFHSYQMSREDFVMVMKTFTAVFPEAQLFNISSDYLILGSRDPIVFDYDKMTAILESNPAIRSDLRHFGEFDQHFIQGSFLMSGHDFRKGLDQVVSPLNTDDHLRLEYNAPINVNKPWSGDIEQWLSSIDRTSYMPAMKGWSEDKAETLPGMWKLYFAHARRAALGGRFEDAIQLFEKALRLRPDDPEIYFRMAVVYESAKRYDDAVRTYSKLEGLPEWEIRHGCGVRRAKILKRISEEPILDRDWQAHNMIASLSFYMGDKPRALREIDIARALNPSAIKNYDDMVIYYSESGREDEARQAIAQAEQLLGDAALSEAKERLKAMERLAWMRSRAADAKAHLLAQDPERAMQILGELVQRGFHEPGVYELMAEAAALSGDGQQAAILRLKAAQLRNEERLREQRIPVAATIPEANEDAPPATEEAKPEGS